jgi:hypothetical protein
MGLGAKQEAELTTWGEQMRENVGCQLANG